MHFPFEFPAREGENRIREFIFSQDKNFYFFSEMKETHQQMLVSSLAFRVMECGEVMRNNKKLSI